MELPLANNDIGRLIDEKIAWGDELPRAHLGCSRIGDPCMRKLWLEFRWASREKFNGRMLRLFRRGSNEESVVIADLRAIGMVITDCQKRVDFGSHISGSIDGIIQSGVPAAPNKRHILEIKTHGQKSFDALLKDGVEKSKPEHFAQMQLYMHGTGIDRALYAAVNKNDDTYYFERIKYDKDFCAVILNRAKGITLGDRMPEPLSANPSWYQCKFCHCHGICHNAEPVRRVSCRTCAHATAMENSTFFCERWKSSIPTNAQYHACRSHVIHPDLVPWKMDVEKNTDTEACFVVDGKEYMNGENGISSEEMLKEGFFNERVQMVRGIFGGEVV
jgi:hypothetical protein